ncbi:MAG: hypothetical protein DRJ32_04925 [Thermoprotei archaeon]|nr:MAG: hypothetical protein DRJ32_04925 [Thermoprotei archaeon]
MYAPLTVIILDILRRKRSGVARDSELLKELRKLYGKEVTLKDLNRALMELELRKIIYVEPVKKNLRLIHVIDRTYL